VAGKKQALGKTPVRGGGHQPGNIDTIDELIDPGVIDCDAPRISPGAGAKRFFAVLKLGPDLRHRRHDSRGR